MNYLHRSLNFHLVGPTTIKTQLERKADDMELIVQRVNVEHSYSTFNNFCFK